MFFLLIAKYSRILNDSSISEIKRGLNIPDHQRPAYNIT